MGQLLVPFQPVWPARAELNCHSEPAAAGRARNLLVAFCQARNNWNGLGRHDRFLEVIPASIPGPSRSGRTQPLLVLAECHPSERVPRTHPPWPHDNPD